MFYEYTIDELNEIANNDYNEYLRVISYIKIRQNIDELEEIFNL